jgi:hypothetical protein
MGATCDAGGAVCEVSNDDSFNGIGAKRSVILA